MIFTCQNCSKEFYTFPAYAKAGHTKHCSRECYNETRKVKEVIRECIKCGKKFVLPLAQARRGRGKYCSKKCKGMGWNSKEKNNPRWNNGRTLHDAGYVLVKAHQSHPYKTKAGYIREHRLMMERYLGRYLLPLEDVHHINGIKTDNRIENLMLFNDRKTHLQIEHKEGKYRAHLENLNKGGEFLRP